jgi:hypothetical protein
LEKERERERKLESKIEREKDYVVGREINWTGYHHFKWIYPDWERPRLCVFSDMWR